jgi:putative transposase
MSLIDPQDSTLSISAQCRLLEIPRASFYYRPTGVSAQDLTLMRLLDEQYLATPFYGSRRMRHYLRLLGFPVGRKRVQRLMQTMGLRAVYPRPKTSRPHPVHKIFPYLLRDLSIDHPNQVWAADITYIPAYSEPTRPPIPIESGHPFRGKAATHSDLKAATHSPSSESVAGFRRNEDEGAHRR